MNTDKQTVTDSRNVASIRLDKWHAANTSRTPDEEMEFQLIKHSHQGDSTWKRYQELAAKI